MTAGAFQHYFTGTRIRVLHRPAGGSLRNSTQSAPAPRWSTPLTLAGLTRSQGAYSDGIGGIAADAAGNAYVSGNASYDFPVTAGGLRHESVPSPRCA